jgi:hypothetical protein
VTAGEGPIVAVFSGHLRDHADHLREPGTERGEEADDVRGEPAEWGGQIVDRFLPAERITRSRDNPEVSGHLDDLLDDQTGLVEELADELDICHTHLGQGCCREQPSLLK